MNPFKDYIDYIKDNPEHYWFRRKLFGWGWTPATKEGWGVTLLFALAIIFLALRIDETASSDVVFRELFLPLLGLIFLLIIIAYKKGEKPKWQWGVPKKEDK